MIGNAVAVDFAEILAKQIMQDLSWEQEILSRLHPSNQNNFHIPQKLYPNATEYK